MIDLVETKEALARAIAEDAEATTLRATLPALRARALQNNEIAVRLLRQSVKGGMAAKAVAS